jgi:acetylornithine/LysW-gamma-L-lysine aminotransferase
MIEQARTIAEREAQHTSGAYTQRPLTLVRGLGSTVWDDAGRAYLDATSGQGVALVGHCHPAVARAVAEQAATLITCPEIFANDRRAEWYDALSQLLPPGFDRFFLCNSGAEANEAALKLARQITGRSGIVAVKRGFHGRTLGALALTWNAKYREPFQSWLPDVTHIAPNDLDAAGADIGDETAAVMVEAVQGEGGVHPLDADYLQALRRLCSERGALLIMDEVQAGLGRTGRWFGFEHAAITPDILTLGKGLAGGVPMGAAIWRGALGAFEAGAHGSTFGGNPLACAAAVATLHVLREERLPERAARVGAFLAAELRARSLAQAREVRGLGLMIGIELRGRATPALKALQERGVLALPAGLNVLRLLPPLVLTDAEAERLVEAVTEVLR